MPNFLFVLFDIKRLINFLKQTHMQACTYTQLNAERRTLNQTLPKA